MQSYTINSKYNNIIQLKVTPGHFATSSSHINSFIDLSNLKAGCIEARAVAKAIMSERALATKEIDTIICMDGTNVVGAYLAEEMSNSGIMSMNANKDINVVTPEQNSIGQLTFRDNVVHTVYKKRVLLLLATASTGRTVEKAVECIEYYGGSVEYISAIFTAADEIAGHQINSIFHAADIDGYASYPSGSCPLCAGNIKLNGIVATNGITQI